MIQEGASYEKTYDYQDLNSINQILDESLTVLLLKIKVDEKYE